MVQDLTPKRYSQIYDKLAKETEESEKVLLQKASDIE